MSGTRTSGSFRDHVHEVVDLDERGASLGTVEESIGSMSLGIEEQAALRVLAASLHAGANINQVVTGPAEPATRAPGYEEESKWSWHDDRSEVEHW
jgi:hypothetical protein